MSHAQPRSPSSLAIVDCDAIGNGAHYADRLSVMGRGNLPVKNRLRLRRAQDGTFR